MNPVSGSGKRVCTGGLSVGDAGVEPVTAPLGGIIGERVRWRVGWQIGMADVVGRWLSKAMCLASTSTVLRRDPAIGSLSRDSGVHRSMSSWKRS
jgi:hypothetical protein